MTTISIVPVPNNRIILLLSRFITLHKESAFVSFLFLKSKLKAYLNIEIDQVDDPLKKSRDVKDIGHYSSGKTEVIIKGKSEIPYALSLIKQAYERS